MRHYIMYIFLLVLLSLNFLTVSLANELTCDEIIKRVENNITFKTAYTSAKMIVHTSKRTDEKRIRSWAEGNKQSYSEVLAPAREAGTKYLKIENDLWMWLPDAEKTIRISGHMLRQSMLGSDMSYEDTMERSGELKEKYSCNLLTEEKISERTCYVMELTAIVKDITYYKRKIWIDKERFIALKEELYSKSGKLLKTLEINDVKEINNRWYGVKMIMRNELRKDSYTEFIIDDIQFDIELDKDMFTQKHLEKR